MQTGTSNGAGTSGRVHIANHSTDGESRWTRLDKSGDVFEGGARDEFPNQCGSFVLHPKTSDKGYLTLGMSGNVYQQNDPWQVTSVTVGTRRFTCGNQWMRPGQLLNCVTT